MGNTSNWLQARYLISHDIERQLMAVVVAGTTLESLLMRHQLGYTYRSILRLTGIDWRFLNSRHFVGQLWNTDLPPTRQ